MARELTQSAGTRFVTEHGSAHYLVETDESKEFDVEKITSL